MYNGIGLQSTRGTGTSGHVQRNVAALHRTHRRRRSNPNPNQKLREAMLRKSSDAHRAHEARRRVEVAVAELEEELNARGYDEDTIVSMAQRLREDLLSRDEDEGRGEFDRELEKGRGGRELVDHRNDKLRLLLGVQDGYVEGTGFRNIRSIEEKVDLDDRAPNDTTPNETVSKDIAPTDAVPKDAAPKDTAPKDTAPNDRALKDRLPNDNVPKDTVSKGVSVEKGKVAYAHSDTESSSLSESSDESDPDDVPEVREKAVDVETEPRALSARKMPPPERTDEVKNASEADEANRKVVHLVEPEKRVPVEQDNASSVRSPRRSPRRSSPPRYKEYGRRRGRSPTPSLLSEERECESPYHRQASPRRRDLSPYVGSDLPRRRDRPRYDRTPPARKRSRDRSPYDRNLTPHHYDYNGRGLSPYDYRRSRYHRSSHRRSRYRTRSRSRSFSRRRYGRYRAKSLDSLSTSSRSASPYGRRAPSPYGPSPSPRRRLSPYGRRPSRRRLLSPLSRKRSYSGYSPSRRVRHRRRSRDEYRYSHRSERRERDRGYSSSDSESSESPPRYRPQRRSRFSDYPSSRSPSLSPRLPSRYPASPAD